MGIFQSLLTLRKVFALTAAAAFAAFLVLLTFPVLHEQTHSHADATGHSNSCHICHALSHTALDHTDPPVIIAIQTPVDGYAFNLQRQILFRFILKDSSPRDPPAVLS